MNDETEVLTDLIANARAGEFDDAELGAWVRCYIKAIEAALAGRISKGQTHE